MLVHMEELLNLPEISVYGYAIEEPRIKIECTSRFAVGVCPYCLTVCSEVKMYYTKSVRDLAMNGKAVILALRERQFCCPECGAYFMERFRFAAPSRTMTARYESYLYDLCKRTSIKQVSIQENLLWDVVQEVFPRHAAAQLKQEARHQHVRWLGIDELALKKGHKDFVAVLVDLEHACVIDVLEQRNKDFIIKYLSNFENVLVIFCFCCYLVLPRAAFLVLPSCEGGRYAICSELKSRGGTGAGSADEIRKKDQDIHSVKDRRVLQ